MQTFTLILSDSASSRAVELARAHKVQVESYLAAEIEDILDRKLISRKHEPSVSTVPEKWVAQDFASKMPDTLQQVLEVCKYVYRTADAPKDFRNARAEFLEAINIVAKNVVNSETGLRGVSVTTVRDKCTTDRRLGLPGVHMTAEKFIGWLCTPEEIRDHLCRKFPRFGTEIQKQFAAWLPKR